MKITNSLFTILWVSVVSMSMILAPRDVSAAWGWDSSSTTKEKVDEVQINKEVAVNEDYHVPATDFVASSPTVVNRRTLQSIIDKEQRFAVYNSRRLTGECLPSCAEDNVPESKPTASPTSTSFAPVLAPPTIQPTTQPTMGPTPSPSTSPITPTPTNPSSSNPSPAMPAPVNEQMRNLFKFFISYRDPRNGMWCDNLAFTNSGVCGDAGSWTYDFYSAASNGWGLISDVIFTELGLLSYEEGRARAYETINNSMQFWPQESTYGFFQHFSNSAYESNSEYSTIDTSILIMGSEFAGNYFGGELRTLADQLFQNVNFQAAIDPDLKPKMYATVEDTGMSGRFIAPYNEYYLLAYLAQWWEGMYNKDTSYAHTYFETYFGLTGKPVGSQGYPKNVDYQGFGVLSDHGGFVASFIPQFCWYTIQAFRDNTYYSQMMENWLQAERAYWTDLDGRYDTMYTWGKNVTGKVFGSAAGDCPQSAYCVSQVGNTESNDDTWSAAVMAGFLGPTTGTLRNQVKQDIDWLYENDICTYEKTYKDGSTSKVLWRCSVNPTYSNWKANRPTSVDFGTMIFGYATNFLQPEFWDMNSI